MSTSNLFVDLLICGMQVAVWLVMLFLTIFGVDWIEPAKLKDWTTTIGIVMLPLVYPLGVFVDHVADTLLTRWRERIRDRYVVKGQTVMELLVRSKDEKLADYYDYLRIRIRISRSSAFNFAIIAILFPVFALNQLSDHLRSYCLPVAVTVSLVSVTIAVLALFSWADLTKSFYEKLKRGLEIVNRMPT